MNIIGYKLIKLEYKEAAIKILLYPVDPGYWHFGLIDFDLNFSLDQNYKIKNDIKDKLEKAGVLKIWFEPVYK